MFGPLGVPELLFILALALLIFGPRRLPEVGRTLGKGLSEFRKASSDLKRTIDAEMIREEMRESDPRRILKQAPQPRRAAETPAADAPAAEAAAGGSAEAPASPASASGEPASPEPASPAPPAGSLARGQLEIPAGDEGEDDEEGGAGAAGDASESRSGGAGS